MSDALPEELAKTLPGILRSFSGNALSIKNCRRLSGGSVNQSVEVETSSGNFFLKWNSRVLFPGMFLKESRGLAMLAKTATLPVPQVVFAGETASFQFLVLEMIEARSPAPDFATKLGTGLAMLHSNTSATAGLEENNFIGSLVQHNAQRTSWTEFYIEERLQRQLDFARSEGLTDVTLLEDFDKLFYKIPQIIPAEPFSLLHGDLWSGNVITNRQGHAVIIDPAVYFGHREVDLAMTKLFGGFEPRVYSAYNDVFPLEEGHEERIGLYQLYPLLVHLNLFGSAYLFQIRRVLSKYL